MAPGVHRNGKHGSNLTDNSIIHPLAAPQTSPRLYKKSWGLLRHTLLAKQGIKVSRLFAPKALQITSRREQASERARCCARVNILITPSRLMKGIMCLPGRRHLCTLSFSLAAKAG